MTSIICFRNELFTAVNVDANISGTISCCDEYRLSCLRDDQYTANPAIMQSRH